MPTAHLTTPPMSETKPPAATMRAFSWSCWGLWSKLMGLAVDPRHSTALESPALQQRWALSWTQLNMLDAELEAVEALVSAGPVLLVQGQGSLCWWLEDVRGLASGSCRTGAA